MIELNEDGSLPEIVPNSRFGVNPPLYRPGDLSWTAVFANLVYLLWQYERRRTADLEIVHMKEESLRITLNSIGDGVIATDTEGNVTWMNPVASNLTGWTSEEVKGKALLTVFDIINAETGEPAFNPVGKVLDTGKIVGLANHTMLRSKDGSEYQISDSAAPIMDANNQITGVVLVFRDVTIEYQIQEDLLDSESKLAEAQILAKLGHYVLDVASGIWRCSEELEVIFGIDESYKKDIGGWIQLIHPDDLEMMQNYLQDHVLTQHKPFDKEYRIVSPKDGQINWVHGLGKLKIDENNNPVEMFGTIQNITERRKSEAALAVQIEKSAGILKGTNAGTWDWMIQTGEVTFNERWAEIMGKTLDDLAPVDIKTWIENVYPEDLPYAQEKLEAHFSGETDYYDVEFRQPHLDGSLVWINARGKVVEWTEDGKPQRMSGTHLDMGEPRRGC